MLAKPPEEITVGEIVGLLEGGLKLTRCTQNPEVCDRSNHCVTRIYLEGGDRGHSRKA